MVLEALCLPPGLVAALIQKAGPSPGVGARSCSAVPQPLAGLKDHFQCRGWCNSPGHNHVGHTFKEQLSQACGGGGQSTPIPGEHPLGPGASLAVLLCWLENQTRFLLSSQTPCPPQRFSVLWHKGLQAAESECLQRWVPRGCLLG